MYTRCMHGPIDRCGHRDLNCRKENLLRRVPSIGICGWDLRSIMITILYTHPRAGGHGIPLVQVPWGIWHATYWILLFVFYPLIIRVNSSAVFPSTGPVTVSRSTAWMDFHHLQSFS